jgi:hypothetical protein
MCWREYGQRLRGYLVPPVSGHYTFWIASDDGGELWLSTDDTPERRARIASVAGWTSPREWSREAGQQSASITPQRRADLLRRSPDEGRRWRG